MVKDKHDFLKRYSQSYNRAHHPYYWRVVDRQAVRRNNRKIRPGWFRQPDPPVQTAFNHHIIRIDRIDSTAYHSIYREKIQ